MEFILTKQQIPPLIKTKKPNFFYGYVVVGAAFFIQAASWGMYNGFGVFFNPLQTEFGWSRATISGAVSLSLLLHGFVSIFIGGLSDRFGPRLIMMACGSFLGAGYLLLSQVNTVWQLYLIYGLIVAIGMSGMDIVPLSTVARWFIKRRGTMTGITKVGTGVGTIIMPALASGLIIAYDFRVSYAVIGVIVLAVIVSLAQFLRRDPAQMGQLAYGEAEANAGALNPVELGLSLSEAIHTRRFWTLCAVFFTIPFCAFTIIVHIVAYALDLGISAPSAAGIISLIGGVSIAGRFLMGAASDRFGSRAALIICFLVLAAALSWLQISRELWMLYLFATVYGFSHGGFFTLISPTVAEFFGTRSHGIIFGTVTFCGTIGGAIGPVLSGYIFDVTNSYRIAFLVLLSLAGTGLLLTLSLRPTSREQRLNGLGSMT